ncbi:probable tRNA N6-adenosine threonylcarbamoyltransferase, mitochondrial [Aricia agestis]|uniref:probable tRNA N6-adenosine threonylcarbamoyltransferase, mitochondrial n=1 Tax=Aricia agestis TaxID=91739 RepID=UPI001C205A25|nr:probable tRNA N6-adenosine threonylcarbamoyltransferase, mitochondrial [Aricia agestis]
MLSRKLFCKVLNKYVCNQDVHSISKRLVSTSISFSPQTCVLGIETSCDDTGCAVVNGDGIILGEAICSQTKLHVKFGGINPIIARDLHKDNIDRLVNEALGCANKGVDDIDAIAVTVKPGLLVSLEVGVKYAKYLSRKYNKPLIPIHHMEAHALIARMFHKIKFPFLSLLISGGHCLLVVVKDIDDFLLLGTTVDNSPGEVLDKVARRMKLKNIEELSKLSGGRAIEEAAKTSCGTHIFQFPVPLVRDRDCNFSFSGLNEAFLKHLAVKESEHQIAGDEIIPEYEDLCAAFQTAVTEHILHRTERAILFCQKNNFLNDGFNIVVSGGVACNNFIFNSIEKLGIKYNYSVYRPPPQYCTDNGVMIAWNGMEKIRNKCDINLPVEIDPNAPLGESIINDVKKANLKCRVIRVNKLLR